MAYLLSHSGLIGLLEYAGKLTILFSAVIWVSEIDDRQLDRLRKAWSTYMEKNFREFEPNILPKRGSAGRASIVWKGAVRDLIDSGVYLDGADMRGAFIDELDASNGRFFMANFNGAIMDGSNFSDANLDQSTMIETDLIEVNFTNAVASNVDFTNASLVEANFEGAYLNNARMVGSNVLDANFNNADLSGVDFSEAESLTCAQLKVAASIKDAKLPDYIQCKR
ncbi:pentapeptide repeat-containing protein [Vibrio coralliilyticus]|uniref:pentapeptide repeat-containing protein n=1 Tax=Vibrio coralliilyticus TaxID=190893 RepID=UPI00240A95D0|nr:pentapeptide repeat-containing protein [Vibrio coralliilyticus]WFB49800.1 pentapeptide repeat-containing protein [Vibrio coralliilyticus]